MVSQPSIINDGNVVDGIAPSQSIYENNDHSIINGPKRGSAVLHRSLHHEPLRVVSARGQYLDLSNSQRIFDATGGAAVACLGHGNERYAYPKMIIRTPSANSR